MNMNFGNPLLNFLAWIVIIVVCLIVAAWVIDLLRDVLDDDDPVAMINSVVMATTGWDLRI